MKARNMKTNIAAVRKAAGAILSRKDCFIPASHSFSPAFSLPPASFCLTSASRNGTLTVAGTTTSTATNVTVNGHKGVS